MHPPEVKQRRDVLTHRFGQREQMAIDIGVVTPTVLVVDFVVSVSIENQPYAAGRRS